MAIVLADRVRESTSSTGTGTITLSGAVAGYQPFSVIGEGNTTYYALVNGSSWETGIGTYSSNTLTRDTVFASSTGSKISLSGASEVFLTYPATKFSELGGIAVGTNPPSNTSLLWLD